VIPPNRQSCKCLVFCIAMLGGRLRSKGHFYSSLCDRSNSGRNGGGSRCPCVRRKKQKPLTSFEIGAFYLNPAVSYSSIRRPYSTIGAGGLN